MLTDATVSGVSSYLGDNRKQWIVEAMRPHECPVGLPAPHFAIIEACSRSKSRHEQRWAAKVLKQLRPGRQYAGEHDDLCGIFDLLVSYSYGYRKDKYFRPINQKLVAEHAADRKAPQHKSARCNTKPDNGGLRGYRC